jgi:hypothetical protein
MLYLRDSIRDDDPALQRLLPAVEDALSLTALILATWLYGSRPYINPTYLLSVLLGYDPALLR